MPHIEFVPQSSGFQCQIRAPQFHYSGDSLWVVRSLFLGVRLVLCADWAAHGAGARGVPQHAQEDGVVSSGTHWCRRGKETCKAFNTSQPIWSEPNIKLSKPAKTRSAHSRCLKITCHVLNFLLKSSELTLSVIYVFCWFLFYVVLIRAPVTPKNAPQSVPRLYTGNGQVKTWSTSSHFSGSWHCCCSISSTHICCLGSWRMTLLAVGTLLGKKNKNLHRMWNTLRCFAQMCQLWNNCRLSS